MHLASIWLELHLWIPPSCHKPHMRQKGGRAEVSQDPRVKHPGLAERTPCEIERDRTWNPRARKVSVAVTATPVAPPRLPSRVCDLAVAAEVRQCPLRSGAGEEEAAEVEEAEDDDTSEKI
eukprot:s3624_g6.t1